MPATPLNRKLTAILYADVAGYSRLTGNDEEGTHYKVMDMLDYASSTIKSSGGSVLRYAGDAILAEFSSAVTAVDTAISIQSELAMRNQAFDHDKKVLIRIGINIGDVIEDRGEVFGDGVNLAARLEAAAPEGGICISANVHDQIVGKIEPEFEDNGDESFKNIYKPVHVFRWKPTVDKQEKDQRHLQDSLPGKPSIAVLPFTNMSNDPEQEYFADGIAEDIITALSHIKQWFVVARNSSFVYKGRNVDIRETAKALGVRYVLEGSVRKGGNKLRITGQLIEAESGTHLWAGKFDGELDDVFELQDRITESVVGAIEPSLQLAEIARSKRKPPSDIDAYDLYLHAQPNLYAIQAEANEQALKLLHRAIEIDPDYALALASLAWGYEERITRNWGKYGDDDPTTAVELARRAIAADRDDPRVLVLAGFVLVMIARDYDQGLEAIIRAQELNPNIAFVSFLAGAGMCVSGNPTAGLKCIEDAIRVSPGDPGAFFFYTGAALAHLMCDRPAEACELATKSARIYAGWDTTYRVLASAQVQLNRIDEARASVAKLLELAPNLTVSSLGERWPIRDKAFLNKTLETLRSAGLPE